MPSIDFLALVLAALVLIIAVAIHSNFHRIRLLIGIHKFRALLEMKRKAR